MELNELDSPELKQQDFRQEEKHTKTHPSRRRGNLQQLCVSSRGDHNFCVHSTLPARDNSTSIQRLYDKSNYMYYINRTDVFEVIDLGKLLHTKHYYEEVVSFSPDIILSG